VPARRRLDAELVRSGLATSRAHAHQLIAEARVLVNGAVAGKPAHLVAPSDNVTVSGPPPRFVSRGGDKLDAALDHFAVDVTGSRVVDCGASTGGFTDCLLQRGAGSVVALDVGHGQLHPRIRGDDRVTVLERTNIRTTTPELIGGRVDAAVADVSFISLTVVIPPLAALCKPGAPMVLLVKPQFEAGRDVVSRGKGVVTDPAVYAEVRSRIEDALGAAGCEVGGWTDSPIRGGEGNREFFVHATTSWSR
jgi:23S rRNA (cytidine1920-2'-O)/16S rRNA (cytidine1409-2'-O)-methyltransferase